MKEREKIDKLLGDFTEELLAFLEKKKIINLNGKKDKLEVWADFVKTDLRWKKYHTHFINKK